MILTLRESIEALALEDFDCAWGLPTDIYLDPEEKWVYTFLDTNSTPMTAFHKIDLFLLRVPKNGIPESVSEALLNLEGKIEELLSYYRGTEWNGSNHIGQWGDDEDDTEYIEELQRVIAECAIEIESYWDADDWFGDDDAQSVRQLAAQGKSVNEILETLYLGNPSDGMVSIEAAIAWIERVLAETD